MKEVDKFVKGNEEREGLLQLLLNVYSEAENEKEELRAEKEVRIKELELECKKLEAEKERATRRFTSFMYCVTALALSCIIVLGIMNLRGLNGVFEAIENLEIVLEFDNSANSDAESSITDSFNTSVGGDNSGTITGGSYYSNSYNEAVPLE